MGEVAGCRSFQSKTALITGGMGWAWVNLPSCKTGKFFLGSLALSVPICRCSMMKYIYLFLQYAADGSSPLGNVWIM